MFGFVWTFVSIGSIYFLIFCKLYIPKLSYNPTDTKNPQDFHKAFFSVFYIDLINVILTYFFFKDSPRNLLLNNKKEEASEVLEYYVGRKLTEEELHAMQEKIVNTGENKHGKEYTDFRLIFSKRYLKLMLLMMSVFFLNYLSFQGMNVAIPILLKEINKEEYKDIKDINTHSKDLIKESNEINALIFYNLINIPIIPAILIEFKFIGKKYSQIILTTIAFILSGLAMIYKNYFNVLTFISVGLVHFSMEILITWSYEILPTKIRDSALGFLFAFSELGGVLSQFVFIGFAKVNLNITIAIYLATLLLTIIILYFLKKNEIDEIDSELDLTELNIKEENA